MSNPLRSTDRENKKTSTTEPAEPMKTAPLRAPSVGSVVKTFCLRLSYRNRTGVMRTFLLGGLLAGLTAAEAPNPTPPRPATVDQTTPIDPATAKQAEAAADAYLKQLDTRPDPLAETALAEIEVLLLEAHSFIEVQQPLKAGERYLSAIEKRKTISEDQRPLLGKRLRKADSELLVLSRQLLGQPAYDLGDPKADQPPAAPGIPPAGQGREPAK